MGEEVQAAENPQRRALHLPLEQSVSHLAQIFLISDI